MPMAGTIALQTEQTLPAPSLSCDSQNTSRLLLQLLHPLCPPLRSPTASPTSVLILPVFPPFLFIRQNRLVRRPPKSWNDYMGIYISYTFYHLLHHFSSAVPTLKLYSHLRDVGSMLAPCLSGRGFVSERAFSTK